MVILYHYGNKPFGKLCRFKRPPCDTDHKPGGLWLSEETNDGWKNHVLRSMRKRPEEWCFDDLRYVTKFIFDLSQIDNIRVIENKDALIEFIDIYRESDQRYCGGIDLLTVRKECAPANCQGQCFNCYGFHINWARTKSKYMGIALKCYTREMSYKTELAELHWARFDCSSWSIWDTRCLIKYGESEETRYICDGSCVSRYCTVRNSVL